MNNRVANISANKLEIIKKLETEINVVLVAYEKKEDKKEK